MTDARMCDRLRAVKDCFGDNGERWGAGTLGNKARKCLMGGIAEVFGLTDQWGGFKYVVDEGIRDEEAAQATILLARAIDPSFNPDEYEDPYYVARWAQEIVVRFNDEGVPTGETETHYDLWEDREVTVERERERTWEDIAPVIDSAIQLCIREAAGAAR